MSSQDSQEEILSQETFDGLMSNLVRDGIDLNSIEASLARSDSEWRITTQTATETVATIMLPNQNQVPVNNSNGSSIPESACFAGRYGFALDFPTANLKHTKSMKWTYSETLNKLYVQMNLPWPVNFITNTVPPQGSVVRGLVRFKEMEQASEPVQRCANHILGDKHNNISVAIVEHLMRSTNQMAGYSITHSGHRSCAVGLYPRKECDSDHYVSPETFTMACYSSCFGSMCRRPVIVIFTLEVNGQILGRKTVDIRICACPGRDLANEEARQNQPVIKQEVEVEETVEPIACCSTSPTIPTNEATNASKRKKSAAAAEPDENGMYWIGVSTRKRYKLLKKINDGMNLVEGSSSSCVSTDSEGNEEYEARDPLPNAPVASATTHFSYEQGCFTLRRTVTSPAVMDANSVKS